MPVDDSSTDASTADPSVIVDPSIDDSSSDVNPSDPSADASTDDPSVIVDPSADIPSDPSIIIDPSIDDPSSDVNPSDPSVIDSSVYKTISTIDYGCKYPAQLPIAGLEEISWEPGDILVHPKGRTYLQVKSPSSFSPSSEDALAVCVIPPNVLTDTMARFIVAKRDKNTYAWGKEGTLLNNFTTAYNFKSIDGSINTIGLLAVDQGEYVSDLKFLSEEDHNCGYIHHQNVGENMPESQKLHTPYIEVLGYTDDSVSTETNLYQLNPAYRSTENNQANALYDVQGSVNTARMIADGGHPVAEACQLIDFIGDGESRCYIPSAGEMGFLFARFNTINSSLALIGGDIIPYKYNLSYDGSPEEPDFFWTSTQSSANTACIVSTYTRVGDSSLMYIEDASNPYGGEIGAQGYKNDSTSMGFLPFFQMSPKGSIFVFDAENERFVSKNPVFSKDVELEAYSVLNAELTGNDGDEVTILNNN